MQEFLATSEYIDADHDAVRTLAAKLAHGHEHEEQIIRASFEFVRDKIKHSLDYQLNPVTCRASDVLREGTGFCFAKSHLLAALLRANRIPCALVYQRIAFGEEKDRHYWHGLNAVFLRSSGWYRLDPRGLKANFDSRFSPPIECLPFSPGHAGERFLEHRYAQPRPEIIQLLETSSTFEDVLERLLKIEL